MPINIYSIQDHLESEGWGLISDSYVNLRTPLKIICPEGHEQEQSYENWRRYKICQQCLAGEKKFRKNSVPDKGDSYRVLSLDAATITSGYSIFDNKDLVAYGVFKANSKKNYTERINEIKHWLEDKIEEWCPDFVGVENIQFQHNVEMYRTLANLQGVILDTLHENNIPFELVYSSEWRKSFGIDASNRDLAKQEAQTMVEKWYNRKCTQDEADAICIGKHFVLKRMSKDIVIKEGFWG